MIGRQSHGATDQKRQERCRSLPPLALMGGQIRSQKKISPESHPNADVEQVGN